MIHKLHGILKALAPGGVALAYSGGVDSTVLLHALLRLQREAAFPMTAYYFRTPLHTAAETQDALAAARKAGIEPVVMEHDPLQLPELRFNPTDRCYRCKHYMFSSMLQHARAQGLHAAMDGTNADDLGLYRPGLRALRELGVHSPLAEAGLSKAQVRELAAEWGLPCSSKPSAPCLATRFDYGTELTEQALRQAEAGEAVLHRRYPGRALRLRVHGSVARLELPCDLMPRALSDAPELVRELRELGYRHVTLDLLGYRSGSMDEHFSSNA